MKMYDPQVYQKNKEYYQKYNKRIIECECGCFSTYGHLARHRKSKKHSKLITEKEEERTLITISK